MSQPRSHPDRSGPAGIGLRPPYAPFGALLELAERVREVTPSRIDAAYLRGLGLSPNNEPALLSALRYLQLIDERGVPTRRFALLQSRGSARQAALAEVWREGYRQLLDAIAIERATPEELWNFFVLQLGLPAGLASKAVRFFLALARAAGIELSPALAAYGRPPAATRETAPNSPPPTRRTGPGAPAVEASAPEPESAGLLIPSLSAPAGVSVQIQVTITERFTPEQIQAVFAGLRTLYTARRLPADTAE